MVDIWTFNVLFILFDAKKYFIIDIKKGKKKEVPLPLVWPCAPTVLKGAVQSADPRGTTEAKALGP